MVVSIIHPSRSRPVLAFNTFSEWMKNASGHNKIEYILSVDNSDPDIVDYLEFFKDQKIIVGENSNMIMAVNRAAKESHGDIIIIVSDDFQSFEGWDLAIIKAFEDAYFLQDRKGFLLKTFDGFEKWIATLNICDREFYEGQGYIYNPIYTHLFADTENTHIAEITNRLIVRNDLTFIHSHPMYDKSVPKDAGYEKTSSQKAFNEGKAIYLRRVLDGFGMDIGSPIELLTSEASQPHKQWILKEIQNGK